MIGGQLGVEDTFHGEGLLELGMNEVAKSGVGLLAKCAFGFSKQLKTK